MSACDNGVKFELRPVLAQFRASFSFLAQEMFLCVVTSKYLEGVSLRRSALSQSPVTLLPCMVGLGVYRKKHAFLSILQCIYKYIYDIGIYSQMLASFFIVIQYKNTSMKGI